MVPIARIILTFEAADPPVHAPNRLIFNLKTAKALAIHKSTARLTRRLDHPAPGRAVGCRGSFDAYEV